MFIDMESILIKFVVLRFSDKRESLKTFFENVYCFERFKCSHFLHYYTEEIVTWSAVVFSASYVTILRDYTKSEAASEHVWKWSSAVCSFDGSCTFLVDVHHAEGLQFSTVKEI